MAAADSSYEVLVLKMLVDANASLTEVDKNGDIVLYYVVRRRDPENVKSSLEIDTDINSKNHYGSTPVHSAMPTPPPEILLFERNYDYSEE